MASFPVQTINIHPLLFISLDMLLLILTISRRYILKESKGLMLHHLGKGFIYNFLFVLLIFLFSSYYFLSSFALHRTACLQEIIMVLQHTKKTHGHFFPTAFKLEINKKRDFRTNSTPFKVKIIFQSVLRVHINIIYNKKCKRTHFI